MKADLHTHTIESDGILTREELFQKAKEKGLDYIAITDHDVCRHVDDNQRLSERYGVKYIPGIELSTLYQDKSVHILGYFRDDSYRSQAMEDYYVMIKEGRENRARKFIENLEKHFGIIITYEEVYEQSDGLIARPHIARAIIAKYPEYNHDDVFEKFLGNHSPAYVPSTELSVQEGLKLLKDNNALAILAHPVLLNASIHDAVLEYPFDGIEAVYPLNTPRDTALYTTLAKARGMLVTAGSDFHGHSGDTSHGDLGDYTIKDENLERFLEALKPYKP